MKMMMMKKENKEIKQPILVSIDESIVIQNHDIGESGRDTQYHATNNSFDSSIYYPHQNEQSSQQKKDHDKKIDEYSFQETPSSVENQNLNHTQDPSHTTDADKDKVTPENKDSINLIHDVRLVEFPIRFDDIRKCLTLSFRGSVKDEFIWFSITQDLKTEKAVSSRLDGNLPHG